MNAYNPNYEVKTCPVCQGILFGDEVHTDKDCINYLLGEVTNQTGWAEHYFTYWNNLRQEVEKAIEVVNTVRGGAVAFNDIEAVAELDAVLEAVNKWRTD